MLVEKLCIQRSDDTLPIVISIVDDSFEFLKEIRYSFLHIAELAFFDTLKFSKIQSSYLLGRYAAKMALNVFKEDVILTETRIGSGVFQQPVLYLKEAGNIQLSISHTTERAIAVVFSEEHPMGVDVEVISAEQAETIKGIITYREKNKLSLIDTDENKCLTILWTIKEALSKVLKTGLMTPFHLYEIENIEHNEGAIICNFHNFPQYQSISWISDGHAWSVVLPKKSVLNMKQLKMLHL